MTLLVYGANGYTGTLVAERAAERELPLVVAGRRADEVAALGQRLNVEHRVFSLDAPADVDRAMAGVKVVLNCAGPFVRTAQPLVSACLRARAHYLDVTGEIAVFQALFGRDAEARAAGVMLLPGTGFDVVPSDCLAAHVHQRLPTATHLRLAFRASGRMSRGTAQTSIEGAGQGGCIRRDGVLTPVPAGHRTIEVDFGRGPRKAIAIPWGDVFTAYVTTGIPNIEVYIAVPARVRVGLRLTRLLGPLLRTGWLQRRLQSRIQAGPAGPTADERRQGKSLLWGEARDPAGTVVVSRMEAPEGYELTRLTAVALAERVLAGELKAGFQTPARAFGADFVLGFPGVRREDLPPASTAKSA
jgi:short subunit dehydrogenase-like uncharacterized protein